MFILAGTTLVMLPTSVFKAYQKATGAVMDPFVVRLSSGRTLPICLRSTQLLTVTDAQYEAMQSMFFNIGGVIHSSRSRAAIDSSTGQVRAHQERADLAPQHERHHRRSRRKDPPHFR